MTQNKTTTNTHSNFHSSGLRQKVDQLMDILYAGGVNNPMDSIEQISYLLFLRLLTERDEQLAALSKKYKRIFSGKWARYAWGNFVTLTGDQLFDSIRSAIENLHELPDLSDTGRLLFRRATLKIYDRPTLRAVIQSIHEMDLTEHDGADIKGDMYEYLLSKISMSGTNGQFRTPRHIIDLIVEVVDPKPGRRICDPACGTAGFLISAFNHILKQNTSKADLKTGKVTGDKLKPAQWKFLEQQAFTGFDNDANMIKIAILNLYLHKLEKANIVLHNPLTTTRGGTYPGPQYDCILANPPFSGKVQKESILSDLNHGINTRATELLFLKWFIDHLAHGGCAGVIVPEGIIFQSQKAYKRLRKMLVENYLWCVVSLPAGVFNPYSGVKTSILLMDKTLAKKTNKILFVKAKNDGFDLGAQRRPIDKNDLPKAGDFIKNYKLAVMSGKDIEDTDFAHTVEKSKIAESGDWNLSGERYKISEKLSTTKYPMATLDNVFTEIRNGKNVKQVDNAGKYRVTRIQTISNAEVDLKKTKWTSDEVEANYFMQYGDILFSHINSIEHLAKTAMWPNIEEKVVHGINLIRLRPNEKLIMPLYASYIMKSEPFINRAKSFAQKAVNQASIKSSDIKAMEIPLPPLEVQKAIVSEIDDYQKIIDGARQVVDNYKPTIKIDPDWPIVALGEVVKVNAMTIDPSVKYGEKEFVYIDITSVENGTGVVSFDKQIKGVEAPSRARRVVINRDVLLSTVRPNLKAFGYLSNVPENTIASTGFAVLTATNKVVPQFVYYQLFEEYLQKQMIDRMGKGAYPSINQKDVQELQIPLPSLPAQQEIVAQIEAEQQIVNANKKLIKIYDQKIKDKIAEVWGCGTSQAAVRATTPYKNDAAVICLLLQEMEKLQRPTTEFFIQKHIFVTKHHLHLPVNSRFHRKVAGPWSQELKRKAIHAAIKTNWLNWDKQGNLVRGPSFNKGLNHAAMVLGESAAQLAQLVKNLKGFGNNGLERWTTVLKVVEDFKETQQPITRSSIQREINNWPGKSLKEIFAEESVDYTITMMLKHNWLPPLNKS